MAQYPLCNESATCGLEGLVVNYPFYINFYRNKTEINRLNKSGYLNPTLTLTGVIRSECTITSPTILVNLTNVQMQSEIFNSNYAYIERFKRYYNITSVKNVRENLWQIELSVDVLMSYKDSILKLKGLIARNEYKFNDYIEDKSISYRYNKSVEESDVEYVDIPFTNLPIMQELDTIIVEDTSQSGKYTTVKSNIVGLVSAKVNARLLITNGITRFKLRSKQRYDSYYGNNQYTWMIVEESTKAIKAKGTLNSKIGSTILTEDVDMVKLGLLFNGSGNISLYVNYMLDGALEYANNTFIKYTPTYLIQTLSNVGAELPPSYSPDSKAPNSYLPIVKSTDSSAIDISTSYIVDIANLEKFLNKIYLDKPNKSFVISSIVYPFKIDEYSEPSTTGVAVGTTPSYADTKASHVLYQQSPYFTFKPFKIKPKYNSYLDYDPFTKYEIYIPFCSWIHVNGEDVLNNELQLSYVLNYQSGAAVYYLVDVTNNKLISSGNATIGIQIPLDTSNAREIENQTKANNMSMILNTVGSTIAIAGGVASANPIATAGGVMKGASSIANYISTANQMYNVGQAVQSGGDFAIYMKKEPRVRITRMVEVDSTGYAKLIGKPLNEVHTLSELSGYTEVGSIHVEGLDTATLTEIKEVESLLKDGIIL